MDSSLSIRMVRENLALAIALWASAKRGVINAMYVPASTQVVSDTGAPVSVSTPLEVRSDRDLVRCVANQVRGAFAFSVMQTHRMLESVYGGSPLEETDPDLRGARCAFYLLNNTFAQDMLTPTWICPPDYHHQFQVSSIAFCLDASALDGKTVYWDDFGGLNKYLALLEYCGAKLEGASRPKARMKEKQHSITPRVEPEAGAPAQLSDTLEETAEAADDQLPDDTVEVGDDQLSDDSVEGFMRERCLISPTYQIIAGALYMDYVSWCEERGHEPYSQRSFGMRLTSAGLERRRRGRGRHWWMGITLKDGTKE